jgi:hypothetical protein
MDREDLIDNGITASYNPQRREQAKLRHRWSDLAVDEQENRLFGERKPGMPRSTLTPPPIRRAISSAARNRFRPIDTRPRWRRLRRLGARLLTLVLLACMVTGPFLAVGAEAQQPPSQTPPGIQVTYITPQITNTGTITGTLDPWSVQVQPTPTQPIALSSCASPDYIFQGCTLVPAGGDQGPLRRLEDQAIKSVLQQYQLPDSARPLLLRYGRNQVRAALFALVEQAFQTDPAQRTADQQFVVDGYVRLIREKHVQAVRAAQQEYQKWKADPCHYQAPPGFSYAAPSLSSCMGIQLAFSPPESPGLQAFVQYGVAAAYTGKADAAAVGYTPTDSVTSPGAGSAFSGTSSAALLGYGLAGAAGAGVAGAGFGAALPASVVATIFPFATQAGAVTVAGSTVATSTTVVSGAVGAGTVLGILVFAITTAIAAGQTATREAEVPTTLQALVNNNAASWDPERIIRTCNYPVVCFSAGISDDRKVADLELFSSLMLSTLPDYPGTDPAPAVQPGDPQLTVAGVPVDWVQYTADNGTQRSFRLSSDGWFADRAGSDGAGTLALSIQFKDASGGKWAARRVGNQFLFLRTDKSPTDSDYPAPRQSADLSVLNWSNNTVTARVGG